MTADELRAMFPNASEQFIKANAKPVIVYEEFADKEDMKSWTEKEMDELRAHYNAESGVDLDVLAKKFNRTHAAVACKANDLGLCASRGCHIKTEIARRAMSAAQILRASKPGERERMAKQTADNWKKYPHPKGMLGKHHTKEVCASISAFHKGKPIDPAQTLRAMKTKLSRYGTLAPMCGRHGVSWKQGWREIRGNRIFFRSRWEYNYALYLDRIMKEGAITLWEHEPQTFWFESIMRGCRSYLPDFRVTFPNGNIEYHEVKGWMDPRSLTKIKRMAKYHPEITLKVVDKTWFNSTGKFMSMVIPEWECN